MNEEIHQKSFHQAVCYCQSTRAKSHCLLGVPKQKQKQIEKPFTLGVTTPFIWSLPSISHCEKVFHIVGTNFFFVFCLKKKRWNWWWKIIPRVCYGKWEAGQLSDSGHGSGCLSRAGAIIASTISRWVIINRRIQVSKYPAIMQKASCPRWATLLYPSNTPP